MPKQVLFQRPVEEIRMPKQALLQKFRHFVRPLHIGACLVLLSLCVLFVGDLLGFRDDGQASVSEARKTIAESTAMHLSTLANIEDEGAIDFAVSALVTRNVDIQAASLILTGGAVLARYGDESLLQSFAPITTLSHLSVPILNDKHHWGELRLVFAPMRNLPREILGLVFFAFGSLIAFTFLLNKAFIQLDPNRAVPSRVDTAFNLFASGVVILDDQLRVIMANQAACDMGSCSRETLLGSSLEGWNWQTEKDWQNPWATTFHTGQLVSDQPLRLKRPDGGTRLIMASCALVGNESEGARGVIVTLDDVSSIERKNSELAATLQELRSSQKLISAKNKELQRLATTDALTGISNRRVLMETLELEFARAQKNNLSLSCIMTDIDHFKSVNDTYGHGVGDDVIRAVSDTMAAACGENETLGRYGGEEFVVILPGLDAPAAAELAERVRAAIVSLALGDRLAVPKLSSSFGVADMSSGASNGDLLVDLADQALYQAKQGGRNRVCVYDKSKASTDTAAHTVAGAAADTAAETAAEPPKSQPVPIDSSDVRLSELQTLLTQRDREIEVLREFDTLTGIPMRTLFLQRVESELLRAKRHGSPVGVLSFELRDLSRLVSTLGHSAADALVVSVVDRLQQGLRTSDLVSEISAEHSLSRITSNEFGVLLSEIADAAGTMIVVTRLKRLLSQPFLVGEQKVYVGANIGIALSLVENMAASDLFSQASDARVQASTQPEKMSHAFATTTLNDQSHDYIRLESDLHDALNAGQLEVYYQPKFDLVERRIVGMEALLRWRHETRGFVPPDVFVAVAEANGLIEQLSAFVVESTLDQILAWRAMGFKHLVVSVNVSPMQLRAESLVESTLAALERTGVEGQHLEIELTETSVLDNPEKAISALHTLRNVGVGISIDDFGTGYTSLSLLSKLPIDIIKIDRLFIAAMRNSEQDLLIVQSMVSMAHTLGLRVVGEGVETNDEFETLASFGCDMVQGYLISHALPAEEATAFLESQQVMVRQSVS
jgi:diguanylate cyclase (GGDEF)-like protein